MVLLFSSLSFLTLRFICNLMLEVCDFYIYKKKIRLKNRPIKYEIYIDNCITAYCLFIGKPN